MGREHTGAWQYIYLCTAGLICITLLSCVRLKEIRTSYSAHNQLLRGQELLAQGDYSGALRENQNVLSMLGKASPADQALFNMGLIYAHHENPAMDRKKSRELFDKLIEDYPRSCLVEQAHIWIDTLATLAREKEYAAEQEVRIKALEQQTKKEVCIQEEQNGLKTLLRGQKKLAEGDFKGALDENRKVLSTAGKNHPGDEALFNIGLIYAHHENPEKDYAAAMQSFRDLIRDYPRSKLLEQAKMWENKLYVIEEEKQVDIDIEQKKKALENKAVKFEQPPPVMEQGESGINHPGIPPGFERVHRDTTADFKKERVTTVTLKEAGGSLSALALKYYGRDNETLCDLILQANPAITDVRNIDDEQEIAVPQITAESYLSGLEGGNYRVHVGTFTSQKEAAEYRARAGLAAEGFAVDTCQVSSQDTWYRLMTGHFTSKEKALQEVRRLVEQGTIYIPPLR